MPLYQWLCKNNHTWDAMGIPGNYSWSKCPSCGSRGKKVPVAKGIQDPSPAMIRNETFQVIDKSDKSIETQRLLDTGSRTDLDRYMKSKGIRLMEPGEETRMNRHREREYETVHEPKILKEILEKRAKEKSISVK